LKNWRNTRMQNETFKKW